MKTGLKRVNIFFMIKCIISEFYPPKSLFLSETETVGTKQVGEHLYSKSDFISNIYNNTNVTQESFIKSQNRYDGKRS